MKLLKIESFQRRTKYFSNNQTYIRQLIHFCSKLFLFKITFKILVSILIESFIPILIEKRPSKNIFSINRKNHLKRSTNEISINPSAERIC